MSLKRVVITLPATYGFDTQAGGFGLLTNQDVLKVSGGATIAGLTPATAALRDGASQLTIDFSGFNTAAGTFIFLADVDGAAPTLATCAPGLAGLACVASNLVLTTAASTVDGNEIAGTALALTFGGTGYDDVTLPASLSTTTILTAQGSFSGEIVPEPSTYALMGAGLAALALLRRRRG